MIQRELFQTIRELCESALYLFSIDKVGQAHHLLAKCEAILAEHGYGEWPAGLYPTPGDALIN